VTRSNVDVDVAPGDDGFGVRAWDNLRRWCRREERGLSADAWLVALDLLDRASERQLAKMCHVLLKLSDRLLPPDGGRTVGRA
jgi:hypothetical protein